MFRRRRSGKGLLQIPQARPSAKKIDDPARSPEDRVLAAAIAYKQAMLSHINTLPIVLSRGPSTPAALRPVELLVGILRQAGLPPGQAIAGMNTIASAVRGAVGMVAGESGDANSPEQVQAYEKIFTAEEFPYLREALSSGQYSFEEGFEFGVRAIARGLFG